MLAPTLLMLLSSVLLLVLIVLAWYVIRRTRTASEPVVRRSVVYLVSGAQLLVMQQVRRGRLRERLEVPKGKAMHGESPLDAAYRECREESGLRPTDLRLLMSFQTRQRNGKQRGIETWDAVWGTLPTGTPIPFTHRVGGKGRDRGRLYHFRLVPLTAVGLYPPLDVPLPTLQDATADAEDG